jgi:hypothetical protein
VSAIFAASGPFINLEAKNTPTTFKESPTVEEYVREYFEDVPIMTEVARCESRFRHFTKYGDVLRGEINDDDIGVMQINEHYHEDTADKLGYNLYSIDGNLGYARYLYEKEGVKPWKSSRKCWEEHLALK